MVADASFEPDFSQLIGGLASLGPPSLPLSAGCLIPEFAVVHQPADWRSAAWCDLDEVKPPLLREIQGLASGHDAKLLARFVNQPDFRYADSLVDAIVPWYAYTSLNKQSVRIGRHQRI